MKLASGQPARYVGPYDPVSQYMSGALVSFRDGQVYCSRVDYNATVPSSLGISNHQWVDLGYLGPSPSTVVHPWNGTELQYPVGNAGEMSEPATVCSDCWKDADFRNAFRPDKHLYVIKELGL